jgi:hypothetical protein
MKIGIARNTTNSFCDKGAEKIYTPVIRSHTKIVRIIIDFFFRNLLSIRETQCVIAISDKKRKLGTVDDSHKLILRTLKISLLILSP